MRTTVLALLVASAIGLGRAEDTSGLEQPMLAAHNALRTAAYLPPLTWSDRLASVAQAWADQLVASGGFFHRPRSRYGENLFEIRGANAGVAEVVLAWARESREYDYGGNACQGVCGHYTQIVWRETRQVGCAVARAGRREVWVCEYDPPGNYVGERPY